MSRSNFDLTSLFSDLKHKNIVEFIGFTINPFGMVLEYLGGGDLYDYLHSSKPVDWRLRLKLAIDIANGKNLKFR